jgi:predicted ester cyclase
MRKLMMVVAALVLSSGCGGGCKKKRNEEGTGGPPMPTGPETTSGSAGSGSAAPATTPEARAQRYEDCWAAWNANDWQKFGACFATGAVSESPGSGVPPTDGREAIVKKAVDQRAAIPDLRADVGLVLATGNTVIAISAVHGHTKTGTPIGVLYGTVSHFDEAGAVDHEWAYADARTLDLQLAPDSKRPVRAPIDKPPMPHAVVIAKDDAIEHDNVKTFDALLAAYDKHDAKAWGDLFTDDAVWSDQTEKEDRTGKKAVTSYVEDIWKAMPDAHLVATSTWAAGDYVAAISMFDATNDHDSKEHAKTGKKASLPLLVVVQIDHGKIKAGWMMYDAISLFQQLGWTDRLPAMPTSGTGSGSGSGTGGGSGTGTSSGSGAGSGSGIPHPHPPG